MKAPSLICFVAVLLLSCENPFNPYGEYAPRLVVYSVLSNARGLQFVRVSSTQNPYGLNPDEQLADTGLAGADVRIAAGGSTYVFRDTLIEKTHVYVCDSLPVAHGTQYSLEVRSDPLDPVRSAVTVPSAPSIQVPRGTAQSLDGPNPFPLKFSVGLSQNTRRYLIRMYIEFEPQYDTVRQRWEVPFFATDTSLSDAWYPGLQYADRTSFDLEYSGSTYINMLAKIVYRYNTAVKWRNIVFEVFQIGEPLENYSSVVNGFKDELSLRADEPDYSNISGGFGLFGAYTRDEIVRPFPVGFFYNPYPSH